MSVMLSENGGYSCKLKGVFVDKLYFSTDIFVFKLGFIKVSKSFKFKMATITVA